MSKTYLVNIVNIVKILIYSMFEIIIYVKYKNDQLPFTYFALISEQ